ncbi:MAG: hypothetical protein A4E26_00399 [Methanobacterium sp. PtaU1.Bin097]|jgi:hypothetical protein|nr:MAG: hypothetical protein A4E26_00399 [Methanobacterium sp. PtaU1.Bin097]
MKLTEIISDSFKYPGSNPEHLNTNRKRWLIFGLLMFTTLVVIPGIFVAGYALRVTRKTIQGDSKLPEYDEWAGMVLDGLKVIVTTIVYYFIPTILVILGAGQFYLMAYVYGVLNLTLINWLPLIIGVLLFIPVIMFYMMALSNMAYHNRLGAAFNMGEIIQRIETIGYGRFILWWVATMIVSAIFASAGSLIEMGSSIVGFFVVPILINSFITLFQARSMGLIYSEGIDADNTQVNDTSIVNE